MAYALVGYLVGLAATAPLIEAARGVVPWIHTPWWLPAAMMPAALAICIAASLISIRKALSAEPARVFRA
jgi:hypothetical protein